MQRSGKLRARDLRERRRSSAVFLVSGRVQRAVVSFAFAPLLACGAAATEQAQSLASRENVRVATPATIDETNVVVPAPATESQSAVPEEPPSVRDFTHWMQSTPGVRLVRTEEWNVGYFGVTVFDVADGIVACVSSRARDGEAAVREFCVSAPEADDTAAIQPVTNYDDADLEDFAARVGRLMIRFSDGSVQRLRRPEFPTSVRWTRREPISGVHTFERLTDVAIVTARNPGVIQYSATWEPDALQDAHVCARVRTAWFCAPQTPSPHIQTGYFARAVRVLALGSSSRAAVEYESNDRNSGTNASHTSEVFAAVYETGSGGLREISRLPIGLTSMQSTSVEQGRGESERTTIGAGFRYPISAEGTCLHVSPTNGEASSERNFHWFRSRDIAVGSELPSDAWTYLVSIGAMRDPLASDPPGAEEEAASAAPAPIRPELVGLWNIANDGSFHRVSNRDLCID